MPFILACSFFASSRMSLCYLFFATLRIIQKYKKYLVIFSTRQKAIKCFSNHFQDCKQTTENNYLNFMPKQTELRSWSALFLITIANLSSWAGVLGMERILLFALLLCDYRFENKWPFVPLIHVFVIFDLCVDDESPSRTRISPALSTFSSL
jgi:hypothetical protein